MKLISYNATDHIFRPVDRYIFRETTTVSEQFFEFYLNIAQYINRVCYEVIQQSQCFPDEIQRKIVNTIKV